jgi:hypothetical protein
MRLRVRRLIPLISFWILGVATNGAMAAFIDSNLAVSTTAHVGGGGCYPISINPGLIEMLALVDPEWAPVDVGSHSPPFSDPITVHGTVALAKVNEGGDFPGDHTSDDENTFITVDPADMGFVSTGNVSPEGPEAGNMEVEWEIAKYPLFAWPGTGDRFTGVGRWIWDCGHPDADPVGSCSTTMTDACITDKDCLPTTEGGNCPDCIDGETCVGVNFNYHSELHPPQAVAVTRLGHGYAFTKNPKHGQLATRSDVWISADGGGAGDQCLVTHFSNAGSELTINCYPLSHPLADVGASEFVFDMPLPPRPAGDTLPPRIKALDRTPTGLRRARVTATFVDGANPTVHVVVHMTTPIAGKLPSQVGKTVIAGWHRHPTPINRIELTVTGIEVLNPLKAVTPAVALKKRCSVTTTQDCSSSACPSGETCLTLGGPTPGWQIWVEANGEWQMLQGLESVNTPTSVPQNITYDLGLPAGDSLHLHATGKSVACLEAQLYNQSLSRDLKLYGLTDGSTCLADASHNPGTLDVSYTGPDFGSGTSSMNYVTQTIGGDGGTCSMTTTQLCLTDDDCPGGVGDTCIVTGGAYKLHYTITRRP